MGVDVPESRIYETRGARPTKLAVYVEGEPLRDYLARVSAAEAEAVLGRLRAGFATDCLLGNWDVVGLNLDNILVGKDGRVWRIDNGGALGFRAQGGAKPAGAWTKYPTELWSMRGPGNPSAARAFSAVSMAEISRQTRTIDPAAITAAATDGATRELLLARLGEMRRVAIKASDMLVDGWRADYVDDLCRHIVGIRKAGISDAMPHRLDQAPGDVQPVDETGRMFGRLRTQSGSQEKSVTSLMADYLAANGGDWQIVRDWAGEQSGHSWLKTPSAVKLWYAEKLGRAEGDFFWYGHKLQEGQSRLAELRGAHGAKLDTSLTAHHALVQEILGNVSFRFNDQERRLVRIIRTESAEALKGRRKGARGVEIKRGANESGSIFRPTSVGGANTTVQITPHERVTGVYFLERRPGRGGSMFAGDRENEFTFIGVGLKCDVLGVRVDPPLDGGTDAAGWGATLTPEANARKLN